MVQEMRGRPSTGKGVLGEFALPRWAVQLQGVGDGGDAALMFGEHFLDVLPFEPVHAQRFGAHGQRRIADFATKGGDDLIRGAGLAR